MMGSDGSFSTHCYCHKSPKVVTVFIRSPGRPDWAEEKARQLYEISTAVL
jgi:hypothetical protein